MTVFVDPGALRDGDMPIMLDHLARRPDLCLKIIDRAGRIVSINPAGLTLLRVGRDEICGKVWAQLWEEPMRGRIEAAVTAAFEGRAESLGGALRHRTGDVSHWDIEVLPLTDGIGIERVLAVSVKQPEASGEALRPLRHALANAAAMQGSIARMLRRGLSAQEQTALAEQIEEAAARLAGEAEAAR